MKPIKEIILFGNGDVYHDNVDRKPDRNTNDTRRGLLGFSFFRPKFPSLYASFDRTENKSRSEFPFPADNRSSSLLSEIRYDIFHFTPYVRYRWSDFQDEISTINAYKQNMITVGLRRAFGQGSLIYVEGEEDRRDF